MIVLKVGCFVIGLIFILIFLRVFIQSLSLRNWVRVNGSIIFTDIRVARDRDDDPRDLYEPALKYSYAYNSGHYIGTRITILNRAERHLGYAEGILEKYPKGRDVIVYCNPKAPKESVLEPRIEWVAIVGCVGGLILVLFSMLWQTDF